MSGFFPAYIKIDLGSSNLGCQFVNYGCHFVGFLTVYIVSTTLNMSMQHWQVMRLNLHIKKAGTLSNLCSFIKSLSTSHITETLLTFCHTIFQSLNPKFFCLIPLKIQSFPATHTFKFHLLYFINVFTNLPIYTIFQVLQASPNLQAYSASPLQLPKPEA